MKIILSIPILFFCIHGYSQEQIISGKVLSTENNEPLPYVNIGIKDKSVGTVSNENGVFKLYLDHKVRLNDTVIFSYIGYKTKKYLISDLKNLTGSILLQSKNMELDEVVLSAEKVKYKSKKIGRTSKGIGLFHANFYSYNEKDVDDRLSKEKGMKFKLRRNCHIKDLNFNITSNNFKSLKFRVNFYKIEDGIPTEIIVHKNIVFEIKDNFHGWFKVDLEPYDIYLKEDIEEIAVTIQWLESVKTDEKSKYFAIATASSPIHTAFSREKAMDKWNKSGQNLSFYLNAMCE